MKLVQIGRTIINMEQVTVIHLGSEKVTIYFVDEIDSNIELKGNEAEAFRAYLVNYASVHVALSEAQEEE